MNKPWSNRQLEDRPSQLRKGNNMRRLRLLAVAVAVCSSTIAFGQTQDQAVTPTNAIPRRILKPALNIAGTGTLNRVAKWTDNVATLGNSSIFDDGVNVGVGTVSPGGVFDFQRSLAGDMLMRIWNQGAGGAKLRYVAATGATSQLQLTDGLEWLSSIAGNNAIGLQFRVRDPGTNNAESQLDASARVTILRNGNVGIGTTAPTALFHVAGDVKVDGNIGAKYQDVAEWVPATSEMSAGTVVVLNPERSNEVMKSNDAYDTRVAGVVSSQPGIILGEQSASKEMIATTGRVKVWVDATRVPVKIGDLLVSSETLGMAMVSVPVEIGGMKIHRPGTILGKALEPLSSGKGEILVLLTLQ